MVGTCQHPHRKLTKEFLHSVAKGNVTRHRNLKAAKHHPPISSSFPKNPPVASQTTIHPRVAGCPLPSTPPDTPTINVTGRLLGKPITRHDNPTCLNFGRFRRLMFPGALFCSPCDWWEQTLLHKSHLKHPVSAKRHSCTSEHRSFVEPRTLYIVPSNCARPRPTSYKQYDPTVLLQSSDSEDDVSSQDSKNSLLSSMVQDTPIHSSLPIPHVSTSPPLNRLSSASATSYAHDSDYKDNELPTNSPQETQRAPLLPNPPPPSPVLADSNKEMDTNSSVKERQTRTSESEDDCPATDALLNSSLDVSPSSDRRT